MSQIQDALKSFDRYLNGNNVGDFAGQELTISKFQKAEVGKDKEIKWVIEFLETPLKLIMSKGRTQQLADIVGDSEPVGKKIKIEQGVSHGRAAICILPV